MKAMLLGALLLVASALAPATAGAQESTAYNGPQVDFNGDCAVSIGDILISVQERGYQYTVNHVLPEFGKFGPDYCWPPRNIKSEAAHNACGWFDWAMSQNVQTFQVYDGGARTLWTLGNSDGRDIVGRWISVYDFQSGWPQLQTNDTNALVQIRYWCQQVG